MRWKEIGLVARVLSVGYVNASGKAENYTRVSDFTFSDTSL